MVCGRQEVWPVVGGAQLPPWQVLVEGGIGEALLNNYHFAKVISEQSLVSTIQDHLCIGDIQNADQYVIFCSPSYCHRGH